MNDLEDVKISVVIPMYNASMYIEQTLQSVLDQSYPAFEVIVVNNGSTDESEAIVRKYKKIRLIDNSPGSGGPAQPRNIGVEQASGDFVAFLDADDLWVEDKLKSVVKGVQGDRKVDVIYHALNQLNPDGSEKEKRFSSLVCPEYENLLFRGNQLATSSVVVRRSSIIEAGFFNEEERVNTAEDYDLWLKLAAQGCKFLYIDDLLGLYRVHDESASGDATYHRERVFNVYHSHAERLAAKNEWSELVLRKMLDSHTLRYKFYVLKLECPKHTFSFLFQSLTLMIESVFKLGVRDTLLVIKSKSSWLLYKKYCK